MTKTLLSFGHGYSATALSDQLVQQGWQVFGSCRTEDKMPTLKAKGVKPLLWPGDSVSEALEQASHLLLSVAPGADGDPVLNALGDVIAKRADQFEWVGYLSTVGVYGDHQGGWVSEDTPSAPATKRGELRVAAESAWSAIEGLPLHIFRLAGIYGPGRGPFAKVHAGTARRIIKKDQVFSRIHVEDIVQVLLASIEHPNLGAVYNVCDNDPAPPQDVIAFAADLLGVPVPEAIPYDEVEMTPMAKSFYAESKRVRNDRIKDELGVQLRYPDYRAGLRALLETAS